MFMVTDLFAMLPRLELTPTATNVLSVMVAQQRPGGAVPISQRAIALELGILPSVVSRAMGQLADRGLVLRRGNRYSLNPVIAGYETEHEMATTMSRLLEQGGPPPILIPNYQQRPPKAGKGQLTSVA